jgi:hypothetical protein
MRYVDCLLQQTVYITHNYTNNIAACWFVLYGYIKMYGQQNIKPLSSLKKKDWMGPTVGLNFLGEIKFLPLPGFETWIAQIVASHYIGYALRAPLVQREL